MAMKLERRFSNESPLLSKKSRMAVIRDEFLELLTRIEMECNARVVQLNAIWNARWIAMQDGRQLTELGPMSFSEWSEGVRLFESALTRVDEIRNAWIAAQTGA